MSPGPLASANRQTDEPKNEEHHGSYPQDVDSESCAEQDQYQEQSEYQYH